MFLRSESLAIELGLAALVLSPLHAAAQSPSSGEVDSDAVYETVIEGSRPPSPKLSEDRATSTVSRAEIERRLPRSSPDALRYEPGVYVQQTAHGQGSAYIRGLTGQQTVMLFDGIRLNNSTYRQGPNQYFFTLDSQTVDSIEVLRGGASTRWGSDAIGGVILAKPIEPRFGDDADVFGYEPHLRLRAATADDELGGRAETKLWLGRDLGFYGGVGARRANLLECSGKVHGARGDGEPMVPRFDNDGRTQLGTGFDEITADGRIAYRVDQDHTLRLAAYAYRQYDSPRTDQCPAPYAPHDECLRYDEQFRTLVYGVYEAEPGAALAEQLRATLSWQNQHERRTRSRPISAVQNIGRDDVNTWGVTLFGRSKTARPARTLALRLEYGVDHAYDRLGSAAWIRFTDIETIVERSRGQYLEGSRYDMGGVFVEGTARLWERLELRGGGRFAWAVAKAPEDPASGTRAVDKSWFPIVGNAGLTFEATKRLSLVVDTDRSYRAPNLDDLTSRQQTGPGFQFENSKLGPETSWSTEVGARLRGPLTLELWGFRTLLYGAIVKSPREAASCPKDTPQCNASWTRYQLVNASSRSEIRGFETALRAELGHGLSTRATLAYAWGEGPNPIGRPTDPSLDYAERVPLSRIPPLNGTAEIVWQAARGPWAGAGVRWAASQQRLAVSDTSDERIPEGGTPGYAVCDFRVGFVRKDLLTVTLALENIFDAAYRNHGSSVNGPARGLVLYADLGPMWRW